ncbi:MAG: mannosyltransferase [Bogoriella megaspora]|nr:MAG: mannosyltransferase [Bogoriella megaspora]
MEFTAGITLISQVVLFFAVAFSSLFTVFLVTSPSQYDPVKAGEDGSKDGKKTKPKTSVQIVVLGDIGRSPRMQYHAISVAKNGGRVDIIGYKDSDIHPEITSNDSINVVSIPTEPSILRTDNKVLFLLLGPLKVILQIWGLYRTLAYKVKASKWMIVQNPPSIPTLIVAVVICFFRNTTLIIDWHNFGYSILALRLGPSHPLVRISKWYEFFLAQFADMHFTVTDAMAQVLKSQHDIRALPLHDRPASQFQPLSSDQRRDFWKRLRDITKFPDVMIDGLHSGRSKLVVSSTSWTADENFELLLDAFVQYSKKAVENRGSLPYIIVLITGKGPQKKYYEDKIITLEGQEKLGGVTIHTAWLSTEDYASLLGAADLGISLHTSSSGLDLPMKVVDMFGAGLPVAGWNHFEAWSELVKEGTNGRGFKSADGLVDILVDLFGGDEENLGELKKGALKEGNLRWDDEWNPVAGALFGLVEKK